MAERAAGLPSRPLAVEQTVRPLAGRRIENPAMPTPSHRFCVAPMMDWTDCLIKSISYTDMCARIAHEGSTSLSLSFSRMLPPEGVTGRLLRPGFSQRSKPASVRGENRRALARARNSINRDGLESASQPRREHRPLRPVIQIGRTRTAVRYRIGKAFRCTTLRSAIEELSRATPGRRLILLAELVSDRYYWLHGWPRRVIPEVGST